MEIYKIAYTHANAGETEIAIVAENKSDSFFKTLNGMSLTNGMVKIHEEAKNALQNVKYSTLEQLAKTAASIENNLFFTAESDGSDTSVLSVTRV